MNKQDFLKELTAKISSLPQSETSKTLSYYEEMIDDRIEEGMNEEDAVKAMGDIEKIATGILLDQSIPSLMRAKVQESKKNASSQALWITLAIVGFPIWVPLLFAFCAVLAALYITVWSVIISLYAVVVAFGAAALGGLFTSFILFIVSSPATGICIFGMGLVCLALALFTAKPVYHLTLQLIRFTGHALRKIKELFIH